MESGIADALLANKSVSDVFHQGEPDTTLWEFRHGQGCFRQGDLAGLREIKRRASKHALVRDQYAQKNVAPPPGVPPEAILMIPDEYRMPTLDQTVHDLVG